VILRVFRAQIYPDQRAAFSQFLRNEALPTTRAQPGFVDCWVGEPLREDDHEFTFVSVWRDLASLEAFRGRNLDDPGIRPEESAVIRSAAVAHYGLLSE
jgi:quinol monooxygenase YgiN